MASSTVTQHVVYRGTDSLDHELWWSAGSGWRRGELDGVAASMVPAAGDPCGYVHPDGTQHVVYRGTDSLDHELCWSAGSGWVLGRLDGTGGMTDAAGSPCGYVHPDRTQHVVYRGTDDLIHELCWSAGSGWRRGGLDGVAGMVQAAGDPSGYVQ